jgi:ubiquinone/menaquinone biosynthesis C-methylase UbiE
MTQASTQSPLVNRASPTRSYDAAPWLYDLIVGSAPYHRLVWGMHPREHGRFVEKALAAAPPGRLLDAGCGSLLFTAAAYRQTRRPITLLDGSIGMLERGRRRLGASATGANLELRHGDLYELPLEAGSFAGVLHFGVLHCLQSPERALDEMARVSQEGSALFLSCLVLGRKRGDSFLRRLQRAGHVAESRTADEVALLVEGAGYRVTSRATEGSFLFLEATRETPGRSA